LLVRQGKSKKDQVKNGRLLNNFLLFLARPHSSWLLFLFNLPQKTNKSTLRLVFAHLTRRFSMDLAKNRAKDSHIP
jgi:hypothetical protein